MKRNFVECIIQSDINLEHALFCGQTFLWRRAGEGYIGLVDKNPVFARAGKGRLHVQTSSGLEEVYWRRYFDIERDYAAIAKRHCADEHVESACVRYLGLRVLNQPVWETMASFIISANNNIKRIHSIVDRLCEALGSERRFGEGVYHAFPDASQIASAGEAALLRLGLGYRAAYLHNTAQRVAAGYDLAALAGMGYAAALKELLSFQGIGEKVADCILLFSCSYTEAFPVDTWVKKIMRELYGVEGGTKAIKEAGHRLFGQDAGLVQQMLFHSARMGLYKGL